MSESSVFNFLGQGTQFSLVASLPDTSVSKQDALFDTLCNNVQKCVLKSFVINYQNSMKKVVPSRTDRLFSCLHKLCVRYE
jgi:hypothetical protein